jgi:hypothetical protein
MNVCSVLSSLSSSFFLPILYESFVVGSHANYSRLNTCESFQRWRSQDHWTHWHESDVILMTQITRYERYESSIHFILTHLKRGDKTYEPNLPPVSFLFSLPGLLRARSQNSRHDITYVFLMLLDREIRSLTNMDCVFVLRDYAWKIHVPSCLLKRILVKCMPERTEVRWSILENDIESCYATLRQQPLILMVNIVTYNACCMIVCLESVHCWYWILIIAIARSFFI